ncbi:hypothetical protein N0V93_010215 [Gnomoniopsis smithogilvyi]|uniref:Uncharacterized protein n=1 Tax=Gnomoniopsis smithogilvyi TaxID=1191159 RepID=A0A9W8YJY5_9PEZI|nr:hypothetical protein N0V93_010215 [Gnomoniopsis smithogilvyi]
MQNSNKALPLTSGGTALTEGKNNASTKGAPKVDLDKNPVTVEHYEDVKESATGPVRRPIVQKIISDMELPAIDARVGAASPTELAFSFTTIFSIPGGFSVRMDPYGLSMYNTFTPGFFPYTYAEMPESALHLKGATKFTLNATTPVLNDTEVSKWVNATVNGDTTSFSFRASTVLHLGALKMPVNIDKSVTVPALNQLKGFGLNSLQILLPAEASEYYTLKQFVFLNFSQASYHNAL